MWAHRGLSCDTYIAKGTLLSVHNPYPLQCLMHTIEISQSTIPTHLSTLPRQPALLLLTTIRKVEIARFSPLLHHQNTTTVVDLGLGPSTVQSETSDFDIAISYTYLDYRTQEACACLRGCVLWKPGAIRGAWPNSAQHIEGQIR